MSSIRLGQTRVPASCLSPSSGRDISWTSKGPRHSSVVGPIIDLKALNEFLKPKHFKTESAESIRPVTLT